jgi:hypothetical protein
MQLRQIHGNHQSQAGALLLHSLPIYLLEAFEQSLLLV